jgi:hypothetical protein
MLKNPFPEFCKRVYIDSFINIIFLSILIKFPQNQVKLIFIENCSKRFVAYSERLTIKLNKTKIFSLRKYISSDEFHKVVNRFFQKTKLSTVLDTFLKTQQISYSKFEKFVKISSKYAVEKYISYRSQLLS